MDQNDADESRGRLVREIREMNEKLDKLSAQRAEWEQQALDYSQIFEFYVAAVNPKPKVRLEEILEDYGYQTDEGNWRPPLTEQAKLEKGSERQQAVRRKIQRFCKLLEAGDGIPADQRPDAQTLAEWIRHCRRTGSHGPRQAALRTRRRPQHLERASPGGRGRGLPGLRETPGTRQKVGGSRVRTISTESRALTAAETGGLAEIKLAALSAEAYLSAPVETGYCNERSRID